MRRTDFIPAIILVGFFGILGALLTNSKSGLSNTDTFRSVQLVRLDESNTLTRTTLDASGNLVLDRQEIRGEDADDTASGDHTSKIDCRGFTTLSSDVFEYGTGSCEFKVWNCVESLGFDTFAEAPAGAPSSADPDPLCTDLTAAAGVTLDGTTVTHWSQTGVGMSFLVGEIQTITGDCDATFVVSCMRQ